MRNPYALGEVDWAAVAQTAGTFISMFKEGGKDQVANYPIKKQSTLDALNASLNHELPLPPTSIANAQALLLKARDLQRAKSSESNSSGQTVVMLLQERISALENYIVSNGGTITRDTGSGSGQDRSQYNLSSFVEKNPLLIFAGVGLIAYLFLRKKGRKK